MSGDPARWRVHRDVAWVSRADLDPGEVPTAYATRLPRGRPMALEGSACLVWLALADLSEDAGGGTVTELAAAAAAMADVSAEDVVEDVRALISSLADAGLVDAC